MAQENIAPEQSVEDILESIRQIISEDEEAMLAVPETSPETSDQGFVDPSLVDPLMESRSSDDLSEIAHALSETIRSADATRPEPTPRDQSHAETESFTGNGLFGAPRSIFGDRSERNEPSADAARKEAGDRLSEMRERISSSLTLRGNEKSPSVVGPNVWAPNVAAVKNRGGPPPRSDPPQAATPLEGNATRKMKLRLPVPDQVPISAPSSHSDNNDTLMADDVNASVAKSFEALTESLTSQASRSLEDVVSDLLRPQLKIWLDENLPRLVERMVREEIERVSQRRR